MTDREGREYVGYECCGATILGANGVWVWYGEHNQWSVADSRCPAMWDELLKAREQIPTSGHVDGRRLPPNTG